MRRHMRWLFIAVTCLLGAYVPADAVIVLGGRDASGTLDNSGRNLNPAPANLNDYVGTFGGFLGTPIAPQYFVTANHIGNAGGGIFVYSNGTGIPLAYTATLAGTQDDLAIWKVSDTGPIFALYAPLYTGSNEPGLSLVTIGRGTQRGSVLNNSSNQPVGWNWGGSDGARSWGAGTIGAITTVQNLPGFGGDLLSFAFDRRTDSTGNVTNPDQGIFSTGDSGGPTFVFNPADNRYELAGVNSLVDAVSAQPDPNGTAQLNASLYDARGFYDGKDLITGPDPVPLNSFATRISSRVAFIDGVTGLVPEPASGAVLAAITFSTILRRRRT